MAFKVAYTCFNLNIFPSNFCVSFVLLIKHTNLIELKQLKLINLHLDVSKLLYVLGKDIESIYSLQKSIKKPHIELNKAQNNRIIKL